MRNWQFQATEDGSKWEVLVDHVDDTTMPEKKGTVGVFGIPRRFHDRAFKGFRLVTTGDNSNSTHICHVLEFGDL